MSRRASKGSNQSVIIIISLLVIALFAVGVTFLTKKKAAYSSLPPLPVRSLMENGNSLRGNKYQVEGKIEERWVKNVYEGLHLSVEESGRYYPIFIKIPQDLEHPNIEREKHYSFSIEIGNGGIPLATGIQRL